MRLIPQHMTKTALDSSTESGVGRVVDADKAKKKGLSDKTVSRLGTGFALVGTPLIMIAADLLMRRAQINSAKKAYKDAFKNAYDQDAWARAWNKSQSYGFSQRPISVDKVYKVLPDLKNVVTKVDAKKVFRDSAAIHHPDRGGSTEKMQAVNVAWDSFQKTTDYTKLAALMRKKADGYRLSDLADAVGRLNNDKDRSVPAKAGLGLAKAFGSLASLTSIRTNRLDQAAFGGTMLNVPRLVNAFGRLKGGEKSLESFDPEQSHAAVSNLRKRMVGSAVGSVADVGTDLLLTGLRGSGTKLPPFAALAAGKGAKALVDYGTRHTMSDEPVLSRAQAEKFLRAAGTSLPLYAGSGRDSDVYEGGGKFLGKLRGKLIDRKLDPSVRGHGSEILRDGGIIVPLERTKTSAAFWSTMSTNFNQDEAS